MFSKNFKQKLIIVLLYGLLLNLLLFIAILSWRDEHRQSMERQKMQEILHRHYKIDQ